MKQETILCLWIFNTSLICPGFHLPLPHSPSINLAQSQNCTTSAGSSCFQYFSRSWHLEANFPTDILRCRLLCVCVWAETHTETHCESAPAGSLCIYLCVTPKSTLKFKGFALCGIKANNGETRFLLFLIGDLGLLTFCGAGGNRGLQSHLVTYRFGHVIS